MRWTDEGVTKVLRRVVRRARRAVYGARCQAADGYRRWRAISLPRHVPALNPAGVACQWLSTEPPILLAAYWLNERYSTLYSLEPIFQRLRRRTAYFIYFWYWHIAEDERVRTVHRMEQTHRRRFPKHHFIHLCNSTQQLDAFRNEGLDAVFCHQNCLLDEMLYHPMPGADRRFDAVYNGRLKRYKRHELAALVDSLALVYAMQPTVDDPAEVAAIRRKMAHAHFFNHEDGGPYRALDDAEVGACLNQCRVGLCLSAVEGGMFASMEYLLCGLPVVSTASLGGRDVFFDDVNALIVDDTPEAVRAGVATLLVRDVTPDVVRQSVMPRVLEHRRTFQATVQAICDQENVARCFVDEWPALFYNRLHRFQTHEQILRQLDHPAPGSYAA